MLSFINSFNVQCRVIWALCLREIHGFRGQSRLGYLWQIIKVAFGILLLVGIRSVIGAHGSYGMPMPVFFLLGLTTWYIFSGTVNRSLEAVRTNKSLLTFPQITTLDFFISAAIVTFVTEVVVMVFFLGVLYLLGSSWKILDPVTLMFVLLQVSLFSLGLGLLLASISLYFPVVEKLTPIVLRVLFFISGVIFSIRLVQSKVGNILLWNPVATFIEIARGAFTGYAPSQSLAFYINVHFFITVAVLSFGLLLERHTRKRAYVL